MKLRIMRNFRNWINLRTRNWEEWIELRTMRNLGEWGGFEDEKFGGLDATEDYEEIKGVGKRRTEMTG